MAILKIIPLTLILIASTTFPMDQEANDVIPVEELAVLLLSFNPVEKVELTKIAEVKTKPLQTEKVRTPCPHCNRNFTVRGLTRHISSAHPSVSPKIKKKIKYKCYGCLFQSCNKVVVEEHMQRMDMKNSTV